MLSRADVHAERGQVLPIFALLAVVLFVMVAFAIDLGFQYSERRQDVTSADAAALAGALQELSSGSQAATTAALTAAQTDLPTTYTPAQYKALWTGCTDSSRPAGYITGTATDPTDSTKTIAVPCVSFSPSFTRVRVRIPTQTVKTTFARVIGVTTLSSSAVAEAQIGAGGGGGGVLPFPVSTTTGDGSEICLKAPPSGHSAGACPGPTAGNFGYLDSPLAGNAALNTTLNCAKKANTNQNAAVGLDHLLVPRIGPYPAFPTDAERDDACVGAGGPPERPNHMFTYTGSSPSVDLEPGMIGPGPYSDNLGGRLTRFGTFPSTTVLSKTLDNEPLSAFIPSSIEGDSSVPSQCYPSAFADKNYRADMLACFTAYNTAKATTPIFTKQTIAPQNGLYDIQFETRFGYVPMSWQDLSTICTGNCEFDIQTFRAVYIQEAIYNKGAFDPGETTDAKGGLEGVSAFMFNTNMLPKPLATTISGTQSGPATHVSLIK